jgi:hypothetical protein
VSGIEPGAEMDLDTLRKLTITPRLSFVLKPQNSYLMRYRVEWSVVTTCFSSNERNGRRSVVCAEMRAVILDVAGGLKLTDKPVSKRFDDRFRLGMDLHLLVDSFYVKADGIKAYSQFSGSSFVIMTFQQQF